GGSNSSSSESVVPNGEITVKFDPCVEAYEGLKTNTPLAQKLEKGDSVKEPTIRALENPNNYTCEGWYTSDDYTTKWNFQTDTVQESMTLYAKWVQSCSVNYYLTDGETIELKRTVSVSKNGLAQKIDTIAQGYELLGYYKDEALTEEFDFSTPILEETNVYIKRSPYIYLDAKFIAKNFTGVAAGAGENGATFGGIDYIEAEDCVEVNFGYCPNIVDSHIIMQNIPLVIDKSQKLEVTMKFPEGNTPWGAMALYVTSLYEDKSIAVFPGANEEMSASVNLKEIDDEGWVTATIDLGEKLYGGASIWANSTYLGLLRVQFQYAQPSVDSNDTHSVYIKSIKGVADDTYVGAEDTFEAGTLENDSDEVLNAVAPTVENGFSFPADRAQVKGGVVNGTAYNKEEGLLVYMPYRTPYNEVNLQPEEGKTISLDENKAMKLRIKNLGYISYLELKFENTNGFSSSSIEVNLPSQMTEFETLNIDLSGVIGLGGTLKNVKIAANSKGIDNAYIIESIEFVEYIMEPVTGFDF
ncbi:MAG: InlB B-repeat-containing protein, partial [Clostridia bacterium]|nr:InlB B-repeat-containing protein [Clostridia bacterium]